MTIPEIYSKCPIHAYGDDVTPATDLAIICHLNKINDRIGVEVQNKNFNTIPIYPISLGYKACDKTTDRI